MQFITWLHYAHTVAESATLAICLLCEPAWYPRPYTRRWQLFSWQKTPSKHQMKQHRKRHHVPVLSLIGLIDFLIFESFSLLLALFPPHVLTLGSIQALSRSTEQGSVCGVSACLSEGIGKEGSCWCEVAMWVTPPSAGPWSPGPPEEWWRCFFPTPRSVAPEGRRPLSPGPSSPRMEGSGSSLCPPMPSYSGSAACPAGKRTGGKSLFSQTVI